MTSQILIVKRHSPDVMEIKEKYQKLGNDSRAEIVPAVNERPTIVSKPRTNYFEKGSIF